MKIAPSILSADFAELGKEVQELDAAGASYIHVDVMDGHFVPNITFGPNVVKAIRPHTSLPLDVHLMISNPETYIEEFASAGADIITVHVESTPHIHRALQLIKERDIKVGIAINPGTPANQIIPVLDMVDLVLVMTVNPGFGGQTFIPSTLENIKHLKDLKEINGYTYEIEVDGGINPETAEKCADQGADVFVAGSYVFAGNSTYEKQIDQLKQVVEK